MAHNKLNLRFSYTKRFHFVLDGRLMILRRLENISTIVTPWHYYVVTQGTEQPISHIMEILTLMVNDEVKVFSSMPS